MRKHEVKSFSADLITLEDLEYVLGSHYCNRLNQSAYICSLIQKDAAVKRLMDSKTKQDITIPQGWYGGSAGQQNVEVTA